MCAQSLYQGKRITVYVHGDPFMPGKQINVNEHQIPEFEGFFSFLTEKIPHRTGGCYRKIFSPNGTKIRSFDQIEAGKSYVAAKNETYRGPNKEYNYKEISERLRLPLPHKSKGYKKIDYNRRIVPVLHAEKYRDKSGRSYFLNAHSQGLWLKVQVNGDSINPAHRVQVPPSLKGNLMSIKEEIMKSIPFLQVVDRLYKIHNCGGCLENFAEVAEAGELKTGDHLLAVPRMHQLKIDVYDPKGRTNMTVHTSPQNGKHYHFPSFHGNDSPNMFRHNRSLNKHKVLPGIGKNSDSPYSSPGALGNSKHDRRNGRLSDRQEKQKKAKNVDYDRDQGGVYRAKGQTHGHGAHQEDIRSNEKTTPIPKGTELNKQPSTEQKPNASEAGNQTKSQERMDDNAGQK